MPSIERPPPDREADLGLSADGLSRFFRIVLPYVNERQRRLVVGAMAEALGRGGQARVVEASLMSSWTVARAVAEIRAGELPSGRQRAGGGGRRPATDRQPGIAEALDKLLDVQEPGATAETLLTWTSKSIRQLVEELVQQGFWTSGEWVRRRLHTLGYALRPPAHEASGTDHPDPDGQLRYLARQAWSHVAAGQPVVVVDTRTKPAEHRLPLRTDLAAVVDDAGWAPARAGVEAAELAVSSLRLWWLQAGRQRFPDARRLLVAVGAGMGPGSTIPARQQHVAQLAGDTGLEITVCLHPSATYRWNGVEHRFIHLVTACTEQPPTQLRCTIAVVTRAEDRAGLVVQVVRDPVWAPSCTSDDSDRLAEPAAAVVTPHKWHGDWNYTVRAS